MMKKNLKARSRAPLSHSYAEIHGILQITPRKWFSGFIRQLSHTRSSILNFKPFRMPAGNSFTQSILVFHNHLSESGRKNMSLDGTLSQYKVSFDKSYFDRIPVVYL
jgi:hypothetical protein